jgi:formate-dependent nitrite reductase cytochrome c552 subunit
VELKKILPIAAAVIIGIIIASCKYDPWQAGDSPTDVVSITKITRNLEAAKPGDTTYKSQVGTVRMSHKAHQDKGLKCVDCHHVKNNPEREKKCATCHKGDNGYETMHGLCVDCHIAHKEGPQKCKECH